MYSIDCNYYDKKFETIPELIEDIMYSGQDPNYMITKNGTPIGERAIDFITL